MVSASSHTHSSASIGQKRKRAQSPQDRTEEIPWTAARCNRLLRTITSRISVLRRIYKPESVGVEGRNCKENATEHPFAPQPTTPATRSRNARDSLMTDDPDWMPQACKRRRTYASKPRPHVSRAPDRISTPTSADTDRFRTPLVKRLLAVNTLQSPADLPSSPVTESSHDCAGATRRSRQLLTIPSTSADKAYQALLEAFDSLLSITRPTTCPSRLGTRSLLSTCLRKVPAYIQLEEEYDESPDDSGADICQQTYHFLESLGGRESAWPGLREIVRAHAIHTIQQGLRDDIFPQDPLRDLLRVCQSREACPEAQDILCTWVETSKATMDTKIEVLVRECKHFGFRGALIRIVIDMLEAGSLSPGSLCNNRHFWREIVKAFIKPSNRGLAAAFCESYTSLCATNDDVDLLDYKGRTAIYDAFVQVTATAWEQGNRSTTGFEITQTLHRLPVALVSSKRAEAGASLSPAAPQATASTTPVQPALLSSFVLQVAALQQPSTLQAQSSIYLDLDSLMAVLGFSELSIRDDDISIPTRKHPLEPTTELPNFICRVGHYLINISEDTAQEFVESSVHGLLNLSKQQSSSPQASFLRLAALNTARAWSEERDGRNHSLDFECEIEQIVQDAERDARLKMRCRRVPSPTGSQIDWSRTPQDRCVVTTGRLRDSGVDLEWDLNQHEDEEDDLNLLTPMYKGARGLHATRLEDLRCLSVNEQSDDELA